MIRCPICGALNQDGHKICSSCGGVLPQTQIRCPNCGASNPLGNVFCDKCNARLIQSEDLISAEHLDEAEDASSIPPVKSIELPTRTPNNDAPATDETLPDWLRDLAEDAEEPADISDDTPTVDSGTYPDWLSDLLVNNPEFSESSPHDPKDPDDKSEPAFDAEELPDWFTGAETAEETPADLSPAALEQAETTLPDWLTELSDSGAATPEPSETEKLPDWLTTNAAEEATDETAAEEELPDWLLETATTEAGGSPPPSPPLLFADSELPDWLSDAQKLGNDEPEPDAVPSADRHEAEIAAEGFTSLPESEASPVSPPEEDDTLPDWLLTSEEEPATELPEWLTKLAEEPESLTRSDEDVLEPAMETIDAEDLTIAEPQELPDWLTGLDVEAGTEAAAAVVFAEETEPPPTVTSPEERPSWLDEIAPAAEGFAAGATPSTPALLIDTNAAEEEAPPEAPLDEEPAEIPNWLYDLDRIAVEEPSQPEFQRSGEEQLAAAELPSWLQKLAPTGTEIVPPATDAADSTEEPVTADIPDWVRALKPPPMMEGAAPPRSTILRTAAEPEGPLEGLPGVLPALASVDMPPGRQPTAEKPLSESVIAQAQLWQQLLEQPRMARRPVSQERKQVSGKPAVVRLFVATVLILGLLSAFWLLPETLQLSASSPAQTAPGAIALSELLDELQPGDQVILAVEYGNGNAEEMSEIVVPILEHLNAREAQVLMVSTLPEGVILGAALAADSPTVSMLSDSGYLAGNASGISSFLTVSRNEEVKQILVMSAYPERVRWWLEQISLINQSGATPITVGLGLSASAGPRIAPYLQTRSVQGWVVGLPDAIAYRALRNADDVGGYGRILDILVLAHWAAGALLVVGLFASLAVGKKGTR